MTPLAQRLFGATLGAALTAYALYAAGRRWGR